MLKLEIPFCCQTQTTPRKFLGLNVDALNFIDIFGYAGGVSFMSENGDGKRFMNRMSDLSYIN